MNVAQQRFLVKNAIWTIADQRYYNQPTKRGEADESGMDLMLQSILTAAVIMDFRSGKIKNWLIVLGVSAGSVMQILVNQMPWYQILGGALFPILLFYILFRIHALGAGDIKLFSVIGCFWTFQNLMICILFSLMAGAVISFSRLLIQRELFRSLISFYFYIQRVYQKKKILKYPGREMAGHQMHFSVAVFIGFLVTLGVNYGGMFHCPV